MLLQHIPLNRNLLQRQGSLAAFFSVSLPKETRGVGGSSTNTVLVISALRKATDEMFFSCQVLT